MYYHVVKYLIADEDLFHLKEDKVSRCFAEALLTAAGGNFLLDEFIKTLKACLPPGTYVKWLVGEIQKAFKNVIELFKMKRKQE